MRTKRLIAILVLLALAVPASPAHAGGVVSVCDEAHLLAALAGGGTVTFSCSGTITLTAEISIAADTTIDGSGQAVTISGNHTVRVFIVNLGRTLNLYRLTIANGFILSGDGGGIYNGGRLTVSSNNFFGNSASSGGGIFNGGALTVTNSTFSANSASSGGGIYNNYDSVMTVSNSIFSDNSATHAGGISNYDGTVEVSNSTFFGNRANSGGGISNHDGTMQVVNSTFSGNIAIDGYGGGISNYDGTTEVNNSTFSGNIAIYYGGGISNNHGTMTVSNSTFSDNRAIFLGGGIYNIHYGMVTLKNTIVANSPTGGNCSIDVPVIDGGGNLSYPDNSCPGIYGNPSLGPLLNNGGPTETMALGPGSAALDAGIDAICAAPPVNSLDQRGVVRPQGLHCDIGAVEQILEPAAVSLTTLSSESAPATIPPIIVFGLLLVALMSFGVRRRQHHTI